MPEAQGKLSWSPPTGTLGGIVAESIRRAERLLLEERVWRRRAERAVPRPSLWEALNEPVVGVIAEVKRRSPSKGAIRPGIDAVRQAEAYLAGGAAAISVLTEPEHFGGTDDDLVAIANAVSIPTLKKDFHVTPVQLYQARALGASAALLIVRALEPQLLKDLLALACAIGLETIVEVRTEAELELALLYGAEIIGVNNRDLETLVIDDTTAARLVPRIPASRIAIAESGMQTRAHVERAAGFGSDAVLIGSAISAATDPRTIVAALCQIPVQRDARTR